MDSVKRIHWTKILLFVLCSCELHSADNNTRTWEYSSRSKNEALAWQSELRIQLFDLLKMQDLVSRKTMIPLHPEVIFSRENENYSIQEVEFNSTRNRRIRVVLTFPTNSKGKLPAIVCIHGHGANRLSVYDENTKYRGFASKLMKNGYVTISANVWQHRVYEKNRTVIGERLWDLIRCVDYLESLPQVDKSKIGCGGLSLGGKMAMWLGAMDERIAATVSSGFLTKMDQLESNHCLCWKFPGLRELVDFSDIYALIAPRALLCQNGLKELDIGYPVSIAREAFQEIKGIYTDMGCVDKLSFVAHNEGHVIDFASLSAFFDNHIGPRQKKPLADN